jgi:hypothetical protein
VAFPLSIDPPHRHLIDANGRPFFMVGDSAWSLIAQLSREKVIEYLDDRAARGFNTLVVDLLAHLFATNAPANIYGDQPFTTAGDYATPNDAYFAHGKWVIDQAAQRGFLVVLTSSYMGAGGGTSWYVEMKANGPTSCATTKVHRITSATARTSSGCTAVTTTRRSWLVVAVAEGVRDPGVLQTAQNAPRRPRSTCSRAAQERPQHVVHLRQCSPERRGRVGGERSTFLMESTYGTSTTVESALDRRTARRSGHDRPGVPNNPVWHLTFPASTA